MKTLLIATAALALMAGSAHSACNVTVTTPLSASNPFTETDCASAATVAAQGVSIASQGTAITALQTNDGLQDVALASHTATLADHETRITTGETKNAEQDGRLDGHDTAIATHTTQIAGVQAVNTAQDTAIGSLETVTAGHEVRLNAHDAMLSSHAATLKDHGNRLNEHDKGLAIAMALPDAWLSDKKRFGIFGAVGGFGDETALGFAAIGRIDETFSLNAKLGSDTEFKEYGWQVGVGAQW